MKRMMTLGVLLATLLTGAKADVDPNFYIYLCFGQSNMEGNAQAESVDKVNIDKRLRLLATCDYTSPKRTKGEWCDAVPPLVNPVGGLGPTDYFGRTMVAALPANVRVGVVPVAMGGSPIEMFDKDKYKSKLAANPNEWWAQIARNNYGGNPYGRLIEMGKKAQEAGVIKGILLHQGCSNNGDPNWPNMVKKIYHDMLSDLGLSADTVPLFVGETLRQENGGSCYAHNTQVNRMPSVVPTAHVVSSEGLPGNGQDPWHFSAMGYRMLGKRYAIEALKTMGREAVADADYVMGSTLKKFYTVKQLVIPETIAAMPGNRQRIAVTALFEDGHSEDVTSQVDFSSSDIEFTSTYMLPLREGRAEAEAVYTDFLRQQYTQKVNIDVSFFPFTKANISQLSGTLTYNEAARTVKLTAGGQAGWVYNAGADMSGYRFLVVKLKEPQECGAQIRIYNKNSINSTSYKDTINARTTVVIDLHHMVYNAKGATIDPSKVFIVAIRTSKAGTVAFDDIFLTNDEQYGDATAINGSVTRNGSPSPVFTLDGRHADPRSLRPGIYVQDGRKLVRR